MRAAVLRAIGDETLDLVDDLVLGSVGPTQVRVRIHATGVCHSDLHGMEGAIGVVLPTVLGHEGAGEVLEVGDAVTSVAVGDHVIVAWSPPCGRCPACVDHGQPQLCTVIQFAAAGESHWTEGDVDVYGFAGTGTFAEELILAQEACIPIDADVPWDVASLIGCGVTTGVGAAINTARVRPGSTCVVLGCGGVGMSVIQGCRLAGAAVIVAVDLQPAKLAAAEAFGATHTTTPDGLRALKQQLTGAARGFDYAFEAIGLATTIRSAYESARRGGTVVVVGAGSKERSVELNTFELFFDEKTIKGSYYGSADVRHDFHRLLRLWRAGRLDLEGLITARIPLEGVNDAIAAMKRGETIRTVIEM